MHSNEIIVLGILYTYKERYRMTAIQWDEIKSLIHTSDFQNVKSSHI